MICFAVDNIYLWRLPSLVFRLFDLCICLVYILSNRISVNGVKHQQYEYNASCVNNERVSDMDRDTKAQRERWGTGDARKERKMQENRKKGC